MPPVNNSYRVPTISPLTLVIELGLIILAAIYATSGYINFDPAQRTAGSELEYTTANHYLAAETLRTEGYVPLWQPYLSAGEPLIDGWTSDVLNPFSIGPSYLFGGNTGMKLGVMVAVLIAGLGGWALGRLMGFGSLARVVLAFLCLGKGNLYSMLTVGGYYQFVFNEAFFPWVATGVVGVFWLPNRRWPIVLSAVSITLLFFSGLIWFMLPTLFVLAALGLVHLPLQLLDRSSWAKRVTWVAKISQFIDFVGLRRLIYAGILTILLSSALLLPIVIHYNNLPKQKIQGDTFLDLGTSIDQFFNPDLGKHYELFEVVRTESFNFTLPVWFGIVLLVLTIPLVVFYRQTPPKLWRIYVVGWVIVIFCVTWASGLNPIILMLDNLSPIFMQFKHQWRILAVAAFWLSVLIAIHVNGLWVTFARSDAWQTRLTGIKLRLIRASTVRQLIAGALILICGYASLQVAFGWKTIQPMDTTANLEGPCISWLKQLNPTGFLSTWTAHHLTIWDYLNNHVRHWTVDTDYYPVTPLKPSLLTDFSLLGSSPQYALIYGGDLPWVRLLGFNDDSANIAIVGEHCNQGMVLHNPIAFSYAYSVPLQVVQGSTNTIPLAATTPIDISHYVHGTDYIAIVTDSDPTQSLVVTLQESAYPGWQVEVNGQLANLESVGGQLGVILPPGQGRNQILFQYLPPLWLLGSKLTLLGCLLSIAFLLRAERLIPHSIVDRVQKYNARIRVNNQPRVTAFWQKLRMVITNEHAFDPEPPALSVLPPATPSEDDEVSLH